MFALNDYKFSFIFRKYINLINAYGRLARLIRLKNNSRQPFGKLNKIIKVLSYLLFFFSVSHLAVALFCDPILKICFLCFVFLLMLGQYLNCSKCLHKPFEKPKIEIGLTCNGFKIHCKSKFYVDSKLFVWHIFPVFD